jgi:hypothetical protein
VGHVRDVDGQAPVAVGQALEADGVVVVARALGVHGDRRPGAEVGAPLDVRVAHLPRHGGRLRLHVGRERVREVVFRHHDLEVHPGVLEHAEHGDHAPERVAGGRGRTRDLGRDHLAGLGVGLFPRGHEQLVEHALVERHHPPAVPAVALVAADDALRPVLEHADDAALRALGRVTLDAGHHPVAVQRLLHVHGGDVHVARARLAVLGHDEPVPGGVRGQAPDHQVHAQGQTHPGPADLHHLAGVDHPAQHRLELAPLARVQLQPAHQLPHGHGLAVRVHQRQHAVLQALQLTSGQSSPLSWCSGARKPRP